MGLHKFYNDYSLKELQKALVQNDTSAKVITIFFEEVKDYAYRYLKGKYERTFNERDFEDAYQEASIAFREAIVEGRYQEKAKLETYFTGICRNKYIDIIRRQQRWIERDKKVTPAANSSSNLEKAAEDRQQELAAIFRTILQDDDQLKLVLYKYQGYSCPELIKLEWVLFSNPKQCNKKFASVKKKIVSFISKNPAVALKIRRLLAA